MFKLTLTWHMNFFQWLPLIFNDFSRQNAIFPGQHKIQWLFKSRVKFHDFSRPVQPCLTLCSIRNCKLWFNKILQELSLVMVHPFWSMMIWITRGPSIKKYASYMYMYELLNLRALKISMLYKNHIFQCMGKIFVWDFKGYLWNSTHNILPIHWKMRILFPGENFRALRFKSS